MSNVFSPKRTSKTSLGFRPYYQSNINADTTYNLRDAQATTKQLATETPVGKAIIDRVTQFTLGVGLFPQSAPETALLGCSDEEYKRFTSEAESFWRYITDSKSYDYYNKNTFPQLQRLAFKNALISGDVLMHRLYRGKREGYKPCIQLISGSSIYNSGMDTDRKNRVGGVELDNKGREIGYWIAQSDDNLNDTFTSKLYSKYNSYGFEEFSLLAFNLLESNQARGIPFLSAVRDAILDINTYTKSTIEKAMVQALFTAFIEHEPEQSAPDTFHATLSNLASQAQEMQGAERDEDEIGFNLASGNVVNLAPGEKINFAESKTPASGFKEFIDVQLDLIGSAVSLPREVLLASFQSSFSASKGSLGVASKAFDIFRKDMADNFCQPNWNMVIDYGIRSGEIHAPGYIDGSDRIKQAWLSATWIGPGAITLNPAQEVGAYVTAIQNGLCTHEQAVRSLYGKDFEEVADRLKKEIDMLNANSNTENKEETSSDSNGEEQ